MPEVKSAQEATKIAHSFVKQYRTYARPMKAVRENDIWLVEIDVGAFVAKVANIKIDVKTADILEYTIPD